MKILVTGSDGYIGSVMTQVLMDYGHEVVGLDTGFYREGWLYNEVKHFPKVISKDTRKVSINDLKGFDAIIHLAELSNDPLGQLSEDITYEINHKGTMKLAKIAKKAGVGRFIYSSSCSVYGSSDRLSNEASPTNPLTAYAKCKLLNEQGLLKMADSQFSPVILRNATVFGPSPRMRFDLAVNNLSGIAWTDGEIKMESDGNPWRPFIHVQDVALAFLCALEAPKADVHKQIFNVGETRSNYQIKDIAKVISKLLPGCRVSLNKNGADHRNYRVNFDKIQKHLPRFKCSETVEDGVRELFKIYKKINLSKEIFNSRHFTRLKQINFLLETNKINDKFFWKGKNEI